MTMRAAMRSAALAVVILGSAGAGALGAPERSLRPADRPAPVGDTQASAAMPGSEVIETAASDPAVTDTAGPATDATPGIPPGNDTVTMAAPAARSSVSRMAAM